MFGFIYNTWTMRRQIEIDVYDGEVLVQRTICTERNLRDGRPGVLWRGVVYPLLDGDRIDVSRPDPADDERGPGVTPAYAVVSGEDASWLLVRGLPSILPEITAQLARAGVNVLRSGRWLGEPIGDVAYDWFLRVDGAIPPDLTLLAGPGPGAVDADPTTRLALLEQRLVELRAHLAQLDAALRTAAAQAARPAAPDPDAGPRDAALQDALARIAALQSQLDAARPAAPAPVRGATRLHEELEAALIALRPDIVPLRDTLQVAVGEFTSRAGFYRCIQELPAAGGRPNGWKALRGVDRWWERHVPTGQDDSGRAYARFDEADRRWHLLLGWKGEQERDIAWLKRR